MTELKRIVNRMAPALIREFADCNDMDEPEAKRHLKNMGWSVKDDTVDSWLESTSMWNDDEIVAAFRSAIVDKINSM
jgi:hypothetical protein